jgi:hypothetical protein
VQRVLLLGAEHPGLFASHDASLRALRHSYAQGDAAMLTAPFAAFASASGAHVGVPTPSLFTPADAIAMPPPSAADDEAFLARLGSATEFAELLVNLGPSFTSNADNVLQVLEQLPAMREQQVALIIAAVAAYGYPNTFAIPATASAGGVAAAPATASGTGAASAVAAGATSSAASVAPWNLEVLMRAVNRVAPDLNWPSVIRLLDTPSFFVATPEALQCVLSMYRMSTNQPFPIEAFTKVWANPRGQLSFIRQAVNVNPDVLCFATPACRRVDATLPRGASPLCAHWLSLDLVDVLLTLAQTEYLPVATDVFELPARHCPEVLLTALAQLRPTWNPLAASLSDRLMPSMFASYPASGPSLHRLWAKHPPMVVRAMVRVHADDPSLVSRLLDIAQDLKVRVRACACASAFVCVCGDERVPRRRSTTCWRRRRSRSRSTWLRWRDAASS